MHNGPNIRLKPRPPCISLTLHIAKMPMQCTGIPSRSVQPLRQEPCAKGKPLAKGQLHHPKQISLCVIYILLKQLICTYIGALL